jgi:hypothetical protein
LLGATLRALIRHISKVDTAARSSVPVPAVLSRSRPAAQKLALSRRPFRAPRSAPISLRRHPPPTRPGTLISPFLRRYSLVFFVCRYSLSHLLRFAAAGMPLSLEPRAVLRERGRRRSLGDLHRCGQEDWRPLLAMIGETAAWFLPFCVGAIAKMRRLIGLVAWDSQPERLRPDHFVRSLPRSAAESGVRFYFYLSHARFPFRLLGRPATSPASFAMNAVRILFRPRSRWSGAAQACAAPRQFVVSKHCAFQAALSFSLFLCFKPQGRASLASSGPPCCNLSPSPCRPALSAGDSDPTPLSSDAAFVTVAFLLARCIPPSLRRIANPCLSLILLPVISLPHIYRPAPPS